MPKKRQALQITINRDGDDFSASIDTCYELLRDVSTKSGAKFMAQTLIVALYESFHQTPDVDSAELNKMIRDLSIQGAEHRDATCPAVRKATPA